MKVAMYDLPKAKTKIRNLSKPAIRNVSGSELEAQGLKNVIPSDIFEVYTRLEILLRIKLSGHSNTLTEAKNLFGELYKRGEIKNEQQYRKALNKFHIRILTNINVITLEKYSFMKNM